MPYLIGTDEAGYGPNLGPLVISATVWHVDSSDLHHDLYDLLADRIVSSPTKLGDAQISIADSKQLYKPGTGLAGLERGLFALLGLLHPIPRSWRQAWEILAPESSDLLNSIPWYSNYNGPIPSHTDHDELTQLVKGLEVLFREQHVALVAIQSKPVFSNRFNELIEEFGRKGEALSKTTLELIASLIDQLDDEPIHIVCDKHGGRNRYGPLLQETFPEYLIEVHREGRAESTYQWGPSSDRVTISFRAKGESFLPSALASMASKYLRELAMQALNVFWQSHLPDLKPTAGYPVDARRFKCEIATVQEKLKIEDRVLWRSR